MFRLQTPCSFVKNIMNEMCKNHKLLWVTELIFCNNPKADGKIVLGFSRENQVGANVCVGLQKCHHCSALLIILKHPIHVCLSYMFVYTKLS